MMNDAIIAALHVLAGGMLIFWGAALFAAGLHCGWRIASEVFGPLQFSRSEHVTRQTFTYRRQADREGGE